jgi:hypothetical protein
VSKIDPQTVGDLAKEARNNMYLRHVPLFLARELARKGNGSIVADVLEEVVQRADELTEFLVIYWKDGRSPLSAGVKRGLAKAFRKFNVYQLAKYDRANTVRLRDVLFLTHPKPKDQDQQDVWDKLVQNELEAPDTWEVALSAGMNKKETWERLLREKRLGGLATLRNLRNMLSVSVDVELIKERLNDSMGKIFPYRFITAAKYAPKLEAALEHAMLGAIDKELVLKGRTCLVVDVSGSMDGAMSKKSEATRIDTACGLAVLLREVCEDLVVYATGGDDGRNIHATAEVPARHGFALRDAIDGLKGKLGGGGIFLAQCMDYIASKEKAEFERVIVLTDEQDCDRNRTAMSAKKLGKVNYTLNLASYQNGTSYGSGWHLVNGWSDQVVRYIQLLESEQ